MNFPQELQYTKDHEWVKVDGNVAIVGITDFAQRELGDIVFVDINLTGEVLNEGAVFGSVEAVKTVSDLFTPVSGKVIEVNNGLNASPESVNTDPYGEGWMVKIELSKPLADTEGLLSSAEYQSLIGA